MKSLQRFYITPHVKKKKNWPYKKFDPLQINLLKFKIQIGTSFDFGYMNTF